MSTVLEREGRREAVRQEADCASVEAIGAGMKVGISSFGAWMLGVGSIIGSMAWLIHGPMLARAGAPAAALAWVLAGILVFPLVFILMELSSMFPSAGGPYVYKYYALKRMFPRTGELFGFLTGWLFWICLIVGLACMANGLANLLSSSLFPGGKDSPIWFGPLVIFALFAMTTLLNLMEIGWASRLNNIFTLMKIAMAVGFAALVVSSGQASIDNILSGTAAQDTGSFWSRVGSVLMLALAGFSCIELTGCTAAETRQARANVPRAVMRTMVTVTLIYLGMCLSVAAASQYVPSADKTTMVVPGTTIQATCPSIAGLLGGSLAGTIFTAGVVASIVGCGFSACLASARIGYSMAQTGLFPGHFGRLCPRTAVPRYALLFQFVCLASIGIAANLASRTGFCADAYTFLAETFGFLYAFLSMLYSICVVSLRYTDPDMPRDFRIGTSGNFLVWLLALANLSIWGFAAFACVNLSHQLAGLFVLLAGLPVYLYYRRTR